jgi:hypothetical protein
LLPFIEMQQLYSVFQANANLSPDTSGVGAVANSAQALINRHWKNNPAVFQAAQTKRQCDSSATGRGPFGRKLQWKLSHAIGQNELLGLLWPIWRHRLSGS